MVLIEAKVVAVKAEVNVEVPVAVIVGQSRVSKGSLRSTRKLKGIPFKSEGPVPLIQKEQGSTAANYEKILQPLIFEVSKQSTGRVIQYTETGFFRDVFKGSVASVAVKTVRKTRWLAYIQIIEAVIVEVARGNAVVAVNVDAASAVKNRSPIIRAAKHLVLIRRGCPQGLVCNVNKT